MSLIDVAAVLVGDPSVARAPELTTLIDAFGAKHPTASALSDAWRKRPKEETPVEWLSEHMKDATLHDCAVDLALTVLLGAVYVAKAVVDASDPGWVFSGRFWKFTGSHPPALSSGPFGHWMYPPGVRP